MKIEKMMEKKKQRSNHQKKTEHQKVAEIRIAELFKQANLMFEEDAPLANRYAQLALKISLKYKVPFNREQKLSYCKKCNSFLKAGKTSKIRAVQGAIILHCLNCQNIRRFKYKK